MKITYESVTGTIEIEVSEHWGRVIAELDYQEDRVNRRETRRHEHLDLSMDESPWLASEEYDPEQITSQRDERDRVRRAMRHLSSKQIDVIVSIHFNGYGITEYAKMRGISQPTATERLRSAERKIKKFL